ncbi:hypothetical protein BFP76_07685 [Amylibacter kogurei]|uniref:Glycosyl transferase family 3 N-terminal domain-containing protein n=1 Tax=Paramylibacter kogurei TaxID=1889778 RepID=A0A2G5K7C2_9RHOB|nr:glycosyl transferase family protein [Amylibacter kogurei]PIB25019.1 hypothetical protein BFP76_07685 [Amylibacter kogurei]
MSNLSKYVYALGRGPSKGRNLTRAESNDAMCEILSGTAAPEAVGALLMLMRYRGETPDEIAGFVDAMRTRIKPWQEIKADLDWPSYAAGRTRGNPWFLLSAKLVALAGFSVVLHGWNSHQNPVASVVNAVDTLNIPVSKNPQQTKTALATHGITYCPLGDIDQSALDLLKLRGVLGLRSAINTALRALNPCMAPATVQGVFHPSYRGLQQASAALLDQKNMTVIKGGGGEFECNPCKDTQIFMCQDGQEHQATLPASIDEHHRLSAASRDINETAALWHGEIQNEFAQQIVISTTTLALKTCDPNLSLDQASHWAGTLWLERHQNRATA